jgi:hypothetical protein
MKMHANVREHQLYFFFDTPTVLPRRPVGYVRQTRRNSIEKDTSAPVVFVC